MSVRNEILLFLLINLTSCGNLQKQSFTLNSNKYMQALRIINEDVNNSELSDIMISNEDFDFNNIAFYFDDLLTDKYEFTKQDFIAEAKRKNRGKNININLSSNKSESKHHLYFSNERQNLFFGEFFPDVKYQITSYENRPSFGKSYAYLFEVKNGKVQLVAKKELAYN